MGAKHILVVGSPTDEFRNIEYLLEFSGCRVTLVRNVREAVDAMTLKKMVFQNLDLILIHDFFSLVQFMDVFNGTITLRERYPIVVIDKFNLKDKFREMFRPQMSEFNIRFCDRELYIVEMEKVLGIRIREVVGCVLSHGVGTL